MLLPRVPTPIIDDEKDEKKKGSSSSSSSSTPATSIESVKSECREAGDYPS